jgi:hypothetical protein
MTPQYGQTQSQAGGAASANLQLSQANAQATRVRVTMGGATGSVVAFFRLGNGAQTATAADMPICGGTYIDVDKSKNDDNFACIAPSGTPTFYVTPIY